MEIAPHRPVSGGQLGVAERTDADWRSLFTEAGLKLEWTSTYAPWGPIAVQRFDRCVGRIGPETPGGLGVEPEGTTAPPSRTTAATARRPIRKAVRSVVRAGRRALLVAGWPLDHVLRLPAPPQLAYYRIYLLSIEA
jgi:hypothetical protein